MKRFLKMAAAVTALCAAMGITAYAGQWQQDSTGWWYEEDDGSYPASTWQWIDGNGDGISECYYFDSGGYMVFDTTINGSQLDENGAWVENGQVQTKKSWALVRQSNDPMEIMRTVSEMNDTQNIDADFVMNMQMTAEGQTIPVASTGNIKMQMNGTDLKYLMDMSMDLGALGGVLHTSAFYTDGWYYYDMGGQKLKMQMDYMEALKNAQAAGLISTDDLSYIQDISMTRNGDSITISYTADGSRLMEQASDIMSISGFSLTEQGMNMSITQCGGEFTVDGNGVCTQQKISMGMTLGVGTENVDMQLYMEMNINAAGSNVVVTIPSTDGYVDMDTYLSQLMEQAA